MVDENKSAQCRPGTRDWLWNEKLLGDIGGAWENEPELHCAGGRVWRPYVFAEDKGYPISKLGGRSMTTDNVESLISLLLTTFENC